MDSWPTIWTRECFRPKMSYEPQPGKKMTAVTIQFGTGRRTFFIMLSYDGEKAVLNEAAYHELSRMAGIPEVRGLTVTIG